MVGFGIKMFSPKRLPMKSTNAEEFGYSSNHTKYVVPDIVHFVWFGNHEWQFHHLLSVLAAYKNIKPLHIYLHCDQEPYGKWWNETRTSVPTFQLVHATPPTEIFGNVIQLPEHKADVYRYQMLEKFGGIYMDLDVIALKSFDPLRKHNFTLGLESPFHLGNGVIVSVKNAEFLKLWYDEYRSFSDLEYNIHSVIVPYILSLKYPGLINVEMDTINYPDWSSHGLDLLYYKRYDWSRNYCIHMWYRLHKKEYTPAYIKTLNSTFGEIARFIYYDKLPPKFGNDK